ncbi:hypothetical protein FOCC_FOCC009610 [Frankliniella occidentalis]|nr:hypothetical protein FOCC_FOCC009610 [Frankliniella occidentalis]
MKWDDRMMKRKGLSVGRRTTIAPKLPQDYKEKLTRFQRFVITLTKRSNHLPGQIGNADQTTLYLDMPSRTSVEEKGKKSVTIKTTRFTVMLAKTADGHGFGNDILWMDSDDSDDENYVCESEEDSGEDSEESDATTYGDMENIMMKKMKISLTN